MWINEQMGFWTMVSLVFCPEIILVPLVSHVLELEEYLGLIARPQIVLVPLHCWYHHCQCDFHLQAKFLLITHT